MGGRLAAERGRGDRPQQRPSLLAIGPDAALEQVEDGRGGVEVPGAQTGTELGAGHAGAGAWSWRAATRATMSPMIREKRKSFGV